MTFWKDKKVLITGHTGFKGSWLAIWLTKLGAKVYGYALQPPTEPNLFNEVRLADEISSTIGDIRDSKKLKQLIDDAQPEIVFHLAAQPLVRSSYLEPVETFETNIMGTVNIFECLRSARGLRVIVNITSDKCYENKEWPWAYRETDHLGGYDPYSASKSCAELVTTSYRKSFFEKDGVLLASARAGNVIGGGDWAEDRIIPDIFRAILKKEEILIRNPKAIRPWQHVLEPLKGYMVLAERMWEDGKYAEAWNFGPRDENIIDVGELTQKVLTLWGNPVSWTVDTGANFKEAQILKLDSSKAKQILGWRGKLGIDATLEWTVEWYQAYLKKADIKKFTIDQIEKYEKWSG